MCQGSGMEVMKLFAAALCAVGLLAATGGERSGATRADAGQDAVLQPVGTGTDLAG